MLLSTDNDLTALAEGDLMRWYFLCGDAGDATNDALAGEIERRAAERRCYGENHCWA